MQLAEHSGVAVNDSSGDVYVADTANHRIDEFDPSKPAGEQFIRAWGWGVADGSSELQTCTTSCQVGLGGSEPGQFESPNFIAVDNSGGTSTGDVYVADTANGLVSKFEADGTLVSSWGVGGQVSGSTATDGPFGSITGVAVDTAGILYVGNSARFFFKFGQDDTFTEDFLTEANSGAFGVAVDSLGLIYKVRPSRVVAKLSASGVIVINLVDTEASGIAVDSSNNDSYVVHLSEVSHLDSNAVPQEKSFGSGHLTAASGIAADAATHAVYVVSSASSQVVVFASVPLPEPVTEPANPIGATSATLNGTVNPEGVPLSECFFEWGETESYGETAACEAPDASEVGAGNTPVPVHADISNLQTATHYHFRLVAANANNPAGEPSVSEDEELLTLGPLISEESASQITANAANISGLINPNGEATSFLVEYVTEAQFQASQYAEATKVPLLPIPIGSGSEFVEVSQQLFELTPGMTYHFRLVASNSAATTNGADRSFTTFTLPGPFLPDGRAYEMISPPRKIGEVFVPDRLGGSCGECLPGENFQLGPMQASPDGEAVAYEGEPFSESLGSAVNSYLGTRSAGGWGEQDLSSAQFSSGVSAQGHQAFSADLSQAILYQVEPVLSPQAPARGGKGFANLYLQSAGSLQPLITAEPPERDPSTGEANSFITVFAGANAGTASSPAFSHVVFEANDALTTEVPGVTPAAPKIAPGEHCEFPGENCNLYEWVGGQPRLVNVLPGNKEAATGATIGSGRLLAAEPTFEARAIDHAISADGSRVFWSGESGQVYVRIDGDETVELQDHVGKFLTATPDGSKVLLSDGCVYDLQHKECEADLTEGQGGFEGILGAAEDLSHVYFIDTKALSGGAENANHEHAEEGKFNLYAWERGAGPSFIGRLATRDNQVTFGAGAWRATVSARTAQVSPDGRYLAFMSQAPLTPGFVNEAKSGECGLLEGPVCFEVFEYDTSSASLSCVSCNPSGQQPLGPSNLSLIRGIPGSPPLRQPANLTPAGNGRLFFESQDVLSQRDTNGSIQDVYEWEPDGVGSCARAGGCVFLISSGNAANDSMFLDSSADGNDAFLVTRERLLPRDQNDQLDLYDARAPHVPGEAVGFNEGETAPCAGEACRGPLSSPAESLAPGSSIFSGPGNFALSFSAPPKPKPLARAQKLAKALKACAKKPPKKRRACRAQAKKRYGPIKARTKPKSHKGGK
jgi:hypothetical protein